MIKIVGGSIDLIEFDSLNKQSHDLATPFLSYSLLSFIYSLNLRLKMSNSFNPKFATTLIDPRAMFVHVIEIAEGTFDEDLFSLMFVYDDSLDIFLIFFIELSVSF